ncbi:MAG: hypothetical protein FWG89_09050 [Treponema sp.]|nr:hypothetical protein [Treponema sp.]
MSDENFTETPDDYDYDISEAGIDELDTDDYEDSEDADVDDYEVDLSESGFPEITKRFETVPHTFFTDPSYYKTALSNEGDISKRVHALLQKYFTVTDPKDRSVFRPQLITAYWEMIRGVAKKAPGKLPEPKKFMLRYHLAHPNFLKTESKEFLAKLVTDNEYNVPVYYVDEWFKAVGTGKIRASTTDEAKTSRGNSRAKLKLLMDKAKGKYEGTKTLLRGKDVRRREMEGTLKELIGNLTEHNPMDGFEDVSASYNEAQRRAFNDVQETLRNLLKNNTELNHLVKEYRQANEDVNILRDKINNAGDDDILDLQSIDTEYMTIRQAVKMTVGRKGNHFPLLTSDYLHSGPNDIGFRENIISMLQRIESIDPEAFCRLYRNKKNRIVPYIVLVPSYGDSGICWEPFDKHNRATSRGRVFIPMYPKNLYIAVLSAVADLRWQVAKEKASYHWMEEGLTGHYYQWYVSQKLKGVVKDYFIQDYIFWMTKESEGIQKLDKEIRGIFWRHMPFAQEIKDKLRTRSYVYQELYQRDLNRAMSDGY